MLQLNGEYLTFEDCIFNNSNINECILDDTNKCEFINIESIQSVGFMKKCKILNQLEESDILFNNISNCDIKCKKMKISSYPKSKITNSIFSKGSTLNIENECNFIDSELNGTNILKDSNINFINCKLNELIITKILFNLTKCKVNKVFIELNEKTKNDTKWLSEWNKNISNLMKNNNIGTVVQVPGKMPAFSLAA